LKLPNFRRLFKGDYDQDQQKLVEQLSGPLNSGIEVLYEALNNKLDFENNFQASVRTIQVDMGPNGIPKGNPIFTLINANRILGTLVLNTQNLTNSSTYPTGAVQISFTQNTNRVTINHITGLSADNQYSITLVAV
jgi:hypothetical protein